MLYVTIYVIYVTHVPAKLLAISTWFENTPENMAPAKQVATIMRMTTDVRSQPEKTTPIRHAPGVTDAVMENNEIQNMPYPSPWSCD